MAKDFMKWRMSTSFRLLGTPHRKKSAVTRMKGTIWPAGNNEWLAEDSAFLCVIPIGWLVIGTWSPESGMLERAAVDQSSCTMIFVKLDGFSLHVRKMPGVCSRETMQPTASSTGNFPSESI